MKRSLQVLLILLLSIAARAQQKYFVYIQSEDKQPFSVDMNDKAMTSSPGGYIVIPKLTNGTYSLSIRSNGNPSAPQLIILTVANADAGYLLKHYGDKGLGLYNTRTLETAMNQAAGGGVQRSADADDVFINILANAANTPVTAQKSSTVVPTTAASDSTPTVSVQPVRVRSVIEKIGGSEAAEGNSYIYVDHYGNMTDTVRVFIATTNNKTAEAPATAPVGNPTVGKEKFLDIELQNPNAKPPVPVMVVVPENKQIYDTATLLSPAVEIKKDKPVVSFNSDCKSIADEADFLKMRKKMAAVESDDAMMSAAKKFLKNQCWSTEQVKNLSLLFLTDAGKYRFFDAAYPRTHDTQNFASLQSQLKEDYFINRFRAMVRIN